ncbi:hypothetical protein D3C73_1263040 [compost metagenome]
MRKAAAVATTATAKPSTAAAMKSKVPTAIVDMPTRTITVPAGAALTIMKIRMRKATDWLPPLSPAAGATAGKSPAWTAQAVPKKLRMP